MTNTDEHLVVFTPSGLRGSFPHGTKVLDAARQLGVDLDSVCGGRGICGRCQVEPTFGEFAKHGITANTNHLSTRGVTENEYKGRRALTDSRRLGCAAMVFGDLVVDVPAESQINRQIVRKDVNLGDLELDPVVVLRLVQVPDPTLDESVGEVRRLMTALGEQWNLGELRTSDILVSDVQRALTAGNRTVTVAIRDDREVVAVWPGLRDRALGIAVDVGSTTIAGHLCDLATGAVLATTGVMNPQIRFGEDLMSRVSYVMMNPGGEIELTTAVRASLNQLVGDLVDQANGTRDEVLELVLVGNPIMHHLFLGYDPTPLGGAPFALAVDEALNLPARELSIEAHQAARVHVLPCIAGHVGADTAAVVLATGLDLNKEEREDQKSAPIRLVVDVGTNAEIVLSGAGRVLAASSPTGPAFEGAQISSGQRATYGAIERVRINPVTGEPRFQIIGVDSWSDEDGFVEAAVTGVTGICGSGIIEVVAELWLAGLLGADGVIGGAGTKPSTRIESDGRTFSYLLYDPADSGLDGERILVTQNDVRAIQLAKAALYAGIRLLMDRLGTNSVDEISLAGAFGSHIDTIRATVLGLIPDCDPDRVASVGNAAGAGAVIALLSGSERKRIAKVVSRIEKIETALEPTFQNHFVDAMAIPHRTADYPQLSTQITLPERLIEFTGPEQTNRRRRRKSASREGDI
ncbi:MAG: ASKHA domain-containing protein [Acidimicrobiales bacterium]|nr:ASKHA domain-containing protein [Acidimicrobiales bacterium]